MYHISLRDVSAIKKIQKDYKNSFDIKNIAQEILQNSLDENQKGEMFISENLILFRIYLGSQELVDKTETKINTGINFAKICRQNKKSRIDSLENFPYSKKHGRGFLSILFHGWDLVTLPNHTEVLIAAIKR